MFNNYDIDERSMAKCIVTFFGKLIGFFVGLIIRMIALAWAIAWGIHLASTL